MRGTWNNQGFISETAMSFNKKFCYHQQAATRLMTRVKGLVVNSIVTCAANPHFTDPDLLWHNVGPTPAVAQEFT